MSPYQAGVSPKKPAAIDFWEIKGEPPPSIEDFSRNTFGRRGVILLTTMPTVRQLMIISVGKSESLKLADWIGTPAINALWRKLSNKKAWIVWKNRVYTEHHCLKASVGKKVV